MTLVWIIDEEWPDLDLEYELFRAALPGADIRTSGYDYAADLEAFGHAADVILAQVYADLPAATIARLDRCRGIAVMGGGYDRVDIDACRRRGIGVTNVKSYCAPDIAEYVLTAILLTSRRLAELAWPGVGAWGAPAVTRLPRRLTGYTCFVLGYGRIGRRVGQTLVRAGVTVLATDPNVTDQVLESDGVTPVSQAEGLAAADYVTVHVNLTPETRHLVGAADLAAMRPDAWLINTSRGAIVDEAALDRALTQGTIAGAILDVVTDEPPTPGRPGVWDRALVTPHISYLTEESFAELRHRSVGNAVALLQGRPTDDLVT